MGRGESETLITGSENDARYSGALFSHAGISLPAKLYHVCPLGAVEAIKGEGLRSARVGEQREGGMTIGGEWADRLYGLRPVYLSVEPWAIPPEERHEHALFEVDSSRLDWWLLNVDAPSLIDHGMCLEGGGVYWEEGDPRGDEIHDELGDEISIDALFESPELARSCFEITRSLAVSGDVSRDALSQIEWPD